MIMNDYYDYDDYYYFVVLYGCCLL